MNKYLNAFLTGLLIFVIGLMFFMTFYAIRVSDIPELIHTPQIEAVEAMEAIDNVTIKIIRQTSKAEMEVVINSLLMNNWYLYGPVDFTLSGGYIATMYKR